MLELDYPNGSSEARLELVADSPELSVSRVRLEPGASLPSHKLGDSVAIIVCEGNALIGLYGRKRPLAAGGVELLTAHDTYLLEATEPTTAYVVRVTSGTGCQHHAKTRLAV